MAGKGKKIILVEDDSAIVDIYETILKKAHLEVEVIGLGQEAIKRIKELKPKDMPDLVLLDLILPDINGVEVLRELRGNELTRGIKVFFLTNQENAEQEAIDVKPDKIIIKANVTPTQLVEIIKEQIS